MVALTPTRWDGCYDANWRDLIVPDAFAHPAKMSRGLVVRIFDHLFALGVLTPSALIVDPFGGIGATAIEGASRGVQVVCCELEPRFVALARENVELHRRDWETMGRPIPVILQGDSRTLRAHLHRLEVLWMLESGAAVEAVISSPPYEEIAAGAGGLNTLPAKPGQQGGRSPSSASQDTDQRYGETPGQLAQLPTGSVEAVISSPPFRDARSDTTRPGPSPATTGEMAEGRLHRLGACDYGDASGQLSALPTGTVEAVISSPPYFTGDSASAQSMTTRTDKSAAWVKANCGSAATEGYGTTEGQLAQLPAGEIDAVISSPPYENSDQNWDDGLKRVDLERGVRAGMKNDGIGIDRRYGTTDGQLGREQGETFWQAADAIVRECVALLKPGGYAVWVVKAFVRKGQVVDFPGDWRRLCEHAGLETLEEIHASLVSEEVRPGLFGDRTVRRERKSFFRRLAESKGSPRIDFEVVLVMRKGTR